MTTTYSVIASIAKQSRVKSLMLLWIATAARLPPGLNGEPPRDEA